jgi:hypothetical protein
MNAIITLSGLLAEGITIERAIYLNEQGYVVTVKYGKVLAQREKQQFGREVVK